MPIQDTLGRVRPPRVHIRLDVETHGAEPKNDLPFVVGVMGDYSGDRDPKDKLPSLRDRKFIKITRDNFDGVMGRMKAGLKFRVKNTLKLKDDGSEIPVELKFNSMRSFEPGSIIEQVEPLRRLLEIKNRLQALMAKADSSTELEDLLERVLQNEDGALDELARELGVKSSGQESPGKEGE